jgi:hypothetical protein
MKKLIFITLISFITTISLSQPIFEKIFDYSQVNGVFDMILTSDSSLLIYGSVGNPGSPVDYVLLIKTDLAGELIWQKNFLWEQTGSWGKQIIESSTGFYFITGSYFHKPLLMKINKEGDTIWSKKWSAYPEHPRNLTTIKQMSINKFVLSCEVSNSLYGAPPGSFMLITDTLGNEICSGAGVDGTIHQTRISENDYFVLGMDWYDYEIVINKNNNCSFVNHLYFEEYNAPSDFEFDDQGNIYLTCPSYNSAIRKINSAGTILWTNNLIPDESVNPESIVIYDNKLITTGNVHPNNEIYQFFISVCDTSGTTDTVYIDQSYYAQGGKKIIKVGNDLYVAGTLRVEEQPTWHPVIFLRKYLLSSLTTSIGSNKALEERKINIFPNPTSSFITININGGQPIEEAIIYNHLGQKALEAVPVNNTVDVSGLKKGMYFIEVATKEWRGRTKLIIKY